MPALTGLRARPRGHLVPGRDGRRRTPAMAWRERGLIPSPGKGPGKGTEHHMGEAPRYATLRDYLRVLREQRVLIIVIAARRRGRGAVPRRAPGPGLRVRGLGPVPRHERRHRLPRGDACPRRRPRTPARRPTRSRSASPTTLARVRDKLKSKEPIGKLRSALSIRTEARTNLVVIQARWGNAKFAADLANAVAEESRRISIDQARQRYRTARRLLKASLKRLGNSRTDKLTQVQYQAQLVKLDTLSRFVSPSKRHGHRRRRRPGPVSPRPVRDTLLGLILGLTLRRARGVPARRAGPAAAVGERDPRRAEDAAAGPHPPRRPGAHARDRERPQAPDGGRPRGLPRPAHEPRLPRRRLAGEDRPGDEPAAGGGQVDGGDLARQRVRAGRQADAAGRVRPAPPDDGQAPGLRARARACRTT